MSAVVLPALWLVILLVGLPLLSETVYSPSLPDIAHAFGVSESMVESTLTMYLFGFAIGTLFWGRVSDAHGRKPCILAGLGIFILGCSGCYLSSNIEMLLAARFIQAFGGSVGSVLGQALCRDAFHGPALNMVYASVGSALAIFPAIGPLIGGAIAEYSGWPHIFLFLLCCASVLSILIGARLPETHHTRTQSISLLTVAQKLVMDRNVLGFGLIIAACNGISFSYYAEGSFYFIEGLGLTPSMYGATFFAIAAASMAGGLTSRKLQKRHLSPHAIMGYGLWIIMFSTALFSGGTCLFTHCSIPRSVMIAFSLMSHMATVAGVCMTTSNALALSLKDYKWCIGTASSLFGFFYYMCISLFTFGMALLHNGTLLPMPLYFMGLAVFMLLVQKNILRTDAPSEEKAP